MQRANVQFSKYAEYKRPQYLLFYFESDKTYDVLSSNSTLLPANFDAEKVTPKENVLIKPDLCGVLIAKSHLEKDMDVYQYKRRLEKSF